MSKLKQITGRLLGIVVQLHISAIGRHVRSFEAKTDAAIKRTDQAASDVENARRALNAARDFEVEAAAEEQAAKKAAHAELAALPDVTGYGRVRTDPPFGAQAQVIDKRK